MNNNLYRYSAIKQNHSVCNMVPSPIYFCCHFCCHMARTAFTHDQD